MNDLIIKIPIETLPDVEEPVLLKPEILMSEPVLPVVSEPVLEPASPKLEPIQEELVVLELVLEPVSELTEEIPESKLTVSQKIVKLLESLKYPSDAIKNQIVSTSSRLEYLLWGCDKTYFGPLLDGYQNTDIPSIILLVSNWLLESYLSMQKNQEVLKKDAEEFYDPDYLTRFSIGLMKSILTSGLIPKVTKKDILLFDSIYGFVVDDVEDLLNLVEQVVQRTCCSSFRVTSITDRLKKLSIKQGGYTRTLRRIRK